MSLAPESRLGPYEILAPIGAGGMGEVYRARDPKLGRNIALKILPTVFATDPDRLARFEREARVLASLDHPNIGPIFGLEESNGVRALVLGLIEGPTLADRIANGPLPPEEATHVAVQIAEAFEYAHDRGVIHRDLKPANVKITPEGVVKVLDFGLAKALEGDEPAGQPGTNSPTILPTVSLGATQPGVSLGTAAYISPEQVKGKRADRRSDIWAFGVVLYEMLVGKRPFAGDSVGEILAGVVKEEPSLQEVPAELRRLVARCLVKDPRKRLQSFGEARLMLEEPPDAQGRTATSVVSVTRSRPLAWVAAAGLLFAALGILGFIHFRETPPPEQTLRYTFAPPENGTVHSFAISPDGRFVAIAAEAGGKRQLWLRPLDTLQAQPMPTTEGATFPFWSPDSRYIGFFAQGKLKKVAVSGGPSQSLCDAPDARGGTWNRDDVILFSPNANAGGIQRVSAAGGVPAEILKAAGVSRYPAVLPDGRHFLYTDIRLSETGGIYFNSLDGAGNRRVLPDRSAVVFAPSAPGGSAGHLLFIRENNLMAVPFDAGNGQVSGDVFPVAENVSLSLTYGGYAPVTVSERGALLYATRGVGGLQQIVWYDRTGKVLGPVGEPGIAMAPAISPDEKTIVYARGYSNTIGVGGVDLWLRDLARGTDTRFTTGGQNFAPFWSPKGDRIVYSSIREANAGEPAGAPALYKKASSGSGQEERLSLPTLADMANQWSRDGRFVVYTHSDPKTRADLWILPVSEGAAGKQKTIPFLQTEFNELEGQLSPDSQWMAYTSDESGQREVYVRPFPPGDGKWKISTAGGDQPRWRGDGKELFYAATDGKMTAVQVVRAVGGPKAAFEPGVPAPLFESHIVRSGLTDLLFQYDVTADGKRFLVVTTGSALAASPPLTVVVNWQAGLKK